MLIGMYMFVIKFINNVYQSLSDPYFETYLLNTHCVYYFVEWGCKTQNLLSQACLSSVVIKIVGKQDHFR